MRDEQSRGRAQITVLTIPSLEGSVIEEYSIKVVDSWKLGTKEKDNGVLLLLAMKDRKMRIEVGQGLEGDLPDAYARRIIDRMTPLMKRGLYDEAIGTGVYGILERVDPEFLKNNNLEETSQVQESRTSSGGFKILKLILYLFIFILFVIFRGFGRHSRHGWHSGGGFGGFGGGGGGGWSGGGGGFSGGGSSGSW